MKRIKFVVNLFIATLFAVVFLFGYSSALKEGQTCVVDKNCEAGLHCETCLANGNVRPRCTRIQPLSPASKVNGLPFNRYSWFTTHNAFARLGEKSATGSIILSPTNQQDSITSQLNPLIRQWSWYNAQGNLHNFIATAELAYEGKFLDEYFFNSLSLHK